MWLSEIWRYPVKSMAGERLREAVVGPGGVPGDRVVQVVQRRSGRVITARTRPRLLGHRAVLGPDGEPQVDGKPWQSAEVARVVEAAAGAGVVLVRSEGLDRFDVLPLLVATDGAIAAFGYDHRRLRPNLVIGGVPGLDERGWAGRVLQVGDVRVGVQDLRQRCIMTTFDPNTLTQDVGVLRHIRQAFGGALALNCFVAAGGRIREGDPVALLESE
jgi:MOSC domain-containing protein